MRVIEHFDCLPLAKYRGGYVRIVGKKYWENKGERTGRYYVIVRLSEHGRYGQALCVHEDMLTFTIPLDNEDEPERTAVAANGSARVIEFKRSI